MKNKRLFFMCFILFLLITFLFAFTNISYCSEPKLVNTVNKAFEQIEKWLMKLATPAAAVAVRYWSFYEKI